MFQQEKEYLEDAYSYYQKPVNVQCSMSFQRITVKNNLPSVV